MKAANRRAPLPRAAAMTWPRSIHATSPRPRGEIAATGGCEASAAPSATGDPKRLPESLATASMLHQPQTTQNFQAISWAPAAIDASDTTEASRPAIANDMARTERVRSATDT